MTPGAKEIVLGLRFNREGRDDQVDQVLAHLRGGDMKTWRDVRWVLMAMIDRWPRAEGAFAAFVRGDYAAWVTEIEQLPEFERFVASVRTMRALGEPDSPKMKRVARLAAAFLARRRRLN